MQNKQSKRAKPKTFIIWFIKLIRINNTKNETWRFVDYISTEKFYNKNKVFTTFISLILAYLDRSQQIGFAHNKYMCC